MINIKGRPSAAIVEFGEAVELAVLQGRKVDFNTVHVQAGLNFMTITAQVGTPTIENFSRVCDDDLAKLIFNSESAATDDAGVSFDGVVENEVQTEEVEAIETPITETKSSGKRGRPSSKK